MTLPRPLRFRSRGEVRWLARHGRRFETELGRITWSRTAGPSASHILFVVSSRVSKRSTDRNRIRRQLAEAFRHQWADRPFPAAAIIHVRPAVSALPGRERRALAQDLARRLASLTREP